MISLANINICIALFPPLSFSLFLSSNGIEMVNEMGRWWWLKYLDTEYIHRRGTSWNMWTYEANRQAAGPIGANGWKRGSIVQSFRSDNSRSTAHRNGDVTDRKWFSQPDQKVSGISQLLYHRLASGIRINLIPIISFCEIIMMTIVTRNGYLLTCIIVRSVLRYITIIHTWSLKHAAYVSFYLWRLFDLSHGQRMLY